MHGFRRMWTGVGRKITFTLPDGGLIEIDVNEIRGTRAAISARVPVDVLIHQGESARDTIAPVIDPPRAHRRRTF